MPELCNEEFSTGPVGTVLSPLFVLARLLLLLLLFCNLTQAKMIWQEGISIKKIPLLLAFSHACVEFS